MAKILCFNDFDLLLKNNLTKPQKNVLSPLQTIKVIKGQKRDNAHI